MGSGMLQVMKNSDVGMPVPDEHYILDDNKYVADILQDFKAAKGRDYQSRILFKKRMFRETDETITEPQFVTLSYVQVSQIPGHKSSTALAPAAKPNARHFASAGWLCKKATAFHTAGTGHVRVKELPLEVTLMLSALCAGAARLPGRQLSSGARGRGADVLAADAGGGRAYHAGKP